MNKQNDAFEFASKNTFLVFFILAIIGLFIKAIMIWGFSFLFIMVIPAVWFINYIYYMRKTP